MTEGPIDVGPPSSDSSRVQDDVVIGGDVSGRVKRTERPIDIGWPLSPSVKRAARRFREGEELNSWDLVRQILELHREYGSGLAGKLVQDIGPSQSEARTAEGWLREVAEIFDSDQLPELHGRLVILGLGRVDPTLAQYPPFAALVEALQRELTPPIETLLRKPPPEAASLSAAIVERRSQVLHALRLADRLATEANREADSVLLLAGLLYMGPFSRSTAAGKVEQALVDALYPDGMQSESVALAALIPDILHLGTTYGIRDLLGVAPIGFAPEHADAERYASWLGEAGEPLTTSFGEELQNLLVGARQLAAPDRQVRGRHLLGAMLSARIVAPPPVVQQHLSNFDPGLEPLRRLLLDHVRQAPEGEPLDVWQQVLLADVPPAAGYLTDRVDEEAPDRLGITEEVETIAYVLTSRQVHPPLSLGLFGDWGSGKSFFMDKLRNAVAAIADRYYREEKATGNTSQWCTRVVQIDFNAWHYSDANLWACLVAHIYDELDRELTGRPSDAELRKQLEGKIEQAEGVVKEAQARRDSAQARVREAAAALQSARQKREQAEQGVRALINDVKALLKPEEEDSDKVRDHKAKLQEELTKAADALGYPEAAASYDALVELDADLKTFSGRLGMLSVSLLRTPWTLVVLALLVLGLPIAVSLLLSAFADQINVIWQRVAEASTFLIGLSAGLRVWIGRGTALIDTVESALEEAQEIRKQRIESSPEVKTAEKELLEEKSAEKAAEEHLLDAQADLQRLETQLKELKPERRLLRLIEERASSAAYSQHLGIISLIRSDFDRMSHLLVNMSAEKRDLTKELPPIQRIILYIDDLDRCRPDRVVEVLEAVHLLLAFPLFVVVVGVDPRWLRHSLTAHYPATLAQTGRHVSGDGPAGPSLISTPQDYLEKIFQIPFALRPVEQSGYLGMIGDLLAPMRAFEPQEPQRRTAAIGEEEQPAEGVEEPPAPEGGQEGDQQEAGEEAPKEEEVPLPTLPPLTLRELSPQQLTFTSWEEADIKRLWPMFRTPRTVKRFVNIYRLLRAGLAGDAEVRRFEGTESEPGEYQVALLLLAVMTSFPNQSSRFLYRLDTWLKSEEVIKSPEDASLQWADLLRALRDTGSENGQPPEAAGDEGAEAEASQPPGSLEDNEPPEDQDPAWEGLIACLDQITRNDFQRPFSRASAERWARRVARYSFSIHPNQAL
jgi:hypothetical protein